jgi:thymidylate kinase
MSPRWVDYRGLDGGVVMVVSFSGIDGAGKSTQIVELESWLRSSGLHTRIVTFWDDIVVLSRYREFMSRRVFKGDQGIGSPEKPLNRRDKNVTSWPVTVLRFCLYFLDAISLNRKVRRLRKRYADVVIFDRYIYDELANLPLNSRFARAFVWLMLKVVPAPDIAYVIDADAVGARARKPEYPLDFLRRNRKAYLTLSQMAADIAVIEPGPVELMQKKIRQEMLREMWAGRKATLAVSH